MQGGQRPVACDAGSPTGRYRCGEPKGHLGSHVARYCIDDLKHGIVYWGDNFIWLKGEREGAWQTSA